MRKKLTQKEAITYRLYNHYKKKNKKPIAVFDFMGEIYCKELKVYGFVSHECSARISEINKDNPDLLKIERVETKTGYYFSYKIKNIKKLIQQHLKQFILDVETKNI